MTRVHLGGGRPPPRRLARAWSSRGVDYVFFTVIAAFAAWVAWRVVGYVGAEVSPMEALGVVGLGGLTLARVLVLIAISSLIWVPVGVLIGLRPALASRVQPVVQFLAAFPQ